MKVDVEHAVAQYKKRFSTYERFTIKTRELVDALLNEQNLSFLLEHRTKDVEAFREKITRPGKSYSDPLREVTDLCGIRIILRRISDVEQVVGMLKEEFDVDEKNSVYKGAELGVDQFGYTSIHLVVSTLASRAALTEWRPYADLKAEIQVRTILQHAWALISHSFDYKVGADIPKEFRRRLFRLSALFELADEELDQLVDDIQLKVESYRASLTAGNKAIELNIDSLRAYIETSQEVQYWNNYLRTHTGQNVATWGDLSRDIRFANYCGIKSLEQINQLLSQARGWGEDFFTLYYDEYFKRDRVTPDKVTTVLNGVVTMLMIAANVERFTPEILAKEFGFGSTFILDVARRTRVQ